MDILSNLLLGFSVALTVQNLLYCFIGVALGTSFGSGNYLLGIITAGRGTGGGDGWQFSFVPPDDPED